MTDTNNTNNTNNENTGAIVPVNLDELIASLEIYYKDYKEPSQEEVKESKAEYVQRPIEKVHTFSPSEFFNWKVYEPDVEYKDRRDEKPYKKVMEDGEETLMPLSTTFVLGVHIYHIEEPGLSVYNEETKTSKKICRFVGIADFDLEQGETVYLRQFPTETWPRMTSFDNKANKPDPTKPDKKVPSNIYGQRGNCRDCIQKGTALESYVNEKGEHKVAYCRARGKSYLLVLAFGSITQMTPMTKEKNKAYRTFFVPGKFDGQIANTEELDMQIFPVEKLYYSDGKPMEPFLLEIDEPPSSTAGKVTKGAASFDTLATQVVKQSKSSLKDTATRKDAYQLLLIENYITMCSMVKGATNNPNTAVAHYEAFDANGSVYKNSNYVPYYEVSPSVNEKILEWLGNTLEAKRKDGSIKSVPVVSAQASYALNEKRSNKPVSTFDPHELIGPNESVPMDSTGAIMSKASPASPMKSAQPAGSDYDDLESVDLDELS